MDKESGGEISAEQRLEVILEVLLAYTRMDFQKTLPVTEAGDEIDAVATGINMLGEELAYSLEKEQAAKKQLEDYSAKLEAKNKELEQFVYITSHDLQEPLRTVTSFSQIIKDLYAPAFDDQGKEMLGFMLEAVDRMGLLLKGLLDYLIINNEETKSPVALTEVVEEAIARNLEDHERDTIVFDASKLPTIKSYKGLLVSLMSHLIANSIKFRDPERKLKIEISAEKIDREWIFNVSDNGIGIEEQYFDRIFRIFQRLHVRSEYSGTGIGLAQCKKIMEALNGKIWVSSEVGKGSTFYFSIPVED